MMYEGLSPAYRAYMERQAAAGGPTLASLTVDEARQLMRDMQTAEVSGYAVTVERHEVPDFAVEVLRPAGVRGPLPVVLYMHGGGWVLGDAQTHARMMREIVLQSRAAVVFVEYGRAPEFPFPLPLEHCYQALEWVAAKGSSMGLEASRLAVAGDSAGGNLTAALALLAKERKGPAICLQALLYPVTDCDFTTGSYEEFSTGLNLDRETMRWFWDRYAAEDAVKKNPLASPLRASGDALQGLPPALVITAEYDVLRDEGEAYGRRLAEASVHVTSVRFMGTLHGFMMIDELSGDAQAVGSMQLFTARLRHALGTEK